MASAAPRKGSLLSLEREWKVGERIGSGGFGLVHEVSSNGNEAVAKFIPKDPGADRELLFADLKDVRNVVPIIDSGETNRHWILVMPRAEKSLRQHLDQTSPDEFSVEDVIGILRDIAEALTDLEGRVVHRDLKPENILLLDGKWCLADFGISRYAEATTAPDTRKFALTPAYAAPERWRNERATSATDVYSLGVMAYEMLAGHRPFPGPSTEDFREQHLHGDPPSLEGVPSLLSALVDECLYKAAGARPGPGNLLQRLDRMGSDAPSGGLARLQAANRQEVVRRAESARRESQALSAEEVRQSLFESASKALVPIGDSLRDGILAAAPSVVLERKGSTGWTLRLNQATLTLSELQQIPPDPWQWEAPSIDVVAHASLSLRIPRDRHEYEGRSHSLWFCDAWAAGEYSWFEVAFMISPLIPRRARQDPFALDPGEAAAKALWTGMAEFQLAWPFTRLTADEIEEFIDRWAGWFADAAEGRLSHPSSMPERETRGSWRH